MEVKSNGVVALTRDVFKIKEREIKDKHYEKHQELMRKIEETPEYQKLAKEVDGLDKQKEKLEEKIDKLKRNIGKDYWEFEKEGFGKAKRRIHKSQDSSNEQRY